ncbi:MAG: hypothetical protein H7144_00165 [Burkholderiales bacterium]|nr:hypothetical protein [Phycisphaerae bacterium]
MSERLGLFLPTKVQYRVRYLDDGWVTYDKVVIPLWTILTPLLLITAWLWYPIIRNRLRGQHETGFAVEMKQPEPVKE